MKLYKVEEGVLLNIQCQILKTLIPLVDLNNIKTWEMLDQVSKHISANKRPSMRKLMKNSSQLMLIIRIIIINNSKLNTIRTHLIILLNNSSNNLMTVTLQQIGKMFSKCKIRFKNKKLRGGLSQKTEESGYKND